MMREAIQQGGGHFGIAKDTGPLAEAQVGGDNNAGPLIEFAEQSGCEEVWLGTEVENAPANALYQSLDPDDVANVIGYTYETD